MVFVMIEIICWKFLGILVIFVLNNCKKVLLKIIFFNFRNNFVVVIIGIIGMNILFKMCIVLCMFVLLFFKIVVCFVFDIILILSFFILLYILVIILVFKIIWYWLLL